MSLLPDEIARRSFTPSADGYHQGEVRAFLERMAREQRALLASMPEGQRLVVDLTMAVAAQETRLQKLEQRLENTVAQLEEVAVTVERTQDRAIQQLAAASRVAAEQQHLIGELGAAVRDARPAPAATTPEAATASPAPAPAATPEPATEASSEAPSDRPTGAPDEETPQPAQPAAPEATPEPTATSTSAVPASGSRDARITPQTERPATQPVRTPLPGSRDARITPAAADAGEPPASLPSPAAEAAPAEPPEAESPAPTVGRGGDSIPDGVIGVRLVRSGQPARPTEPPSESPPETPAALLAAIDEQEPLITDNANDLLDGVLDDVMDNITERPPTP